jgi:hypothetical protein
MLLVARCLNTEDLCFGRVIMRPKFQGAGVREGATAVEQRVRASVNRRLRLEQNSSDLLEKLVELEWLREQVRQAETLDTQQLLAQFKAYRQQKATTARRPRRRAC